MGSYSSAVRQSCPNVDCQLYGKTKHGNIEKNGARKTLDDARGVSIKAGEWFTIKIVHKGEKIEGWLNGKKLLEARDRTFSEAGGVGFWTKTDAATSFDDLTVKPAR